MKPDAWLWSHENSLKVATVNESSPFYHGKGAFSKQPLYLIPADQVLVPRELLEELLEAAKDGAAHKGEYLSKKYGEPELFAKFDTLLHP